MVIHTHALQHLILLYTDPIWLEHQNVFCRYPPNYVDDRQDINLETQLEQETSSKPLGITKMEITWPYMNKYHGS